MRIRHISILAVSLCFAAYGQSTATSEFDVADVRENRAADRPDTVIITDPAAGNPVEVVIYADGRVARETAFATSGAVILRYLTLRELILQAYKKEVPRDEYLTGGAGWIQSDHFDLVAKAQAGTPLDIERVMIRKVLADRFQLAMHREQKPLAVYALTADKKGAKLQPTSGSGPPNCKRTASGFLSKDGKVISQGQGQRSIACTNMTMAEFASRLSKLESTLDRPVIDMTGLTGAFDFDVKWTVELAEPAGTDALDALNRQLGLKVALSKQPVEVLVIDHAEKPSEN